MEVIAWILPRLLLAALIYTFHARSADAASAAKQDFDANCASCHGFDGKGHGHALYVTPQVKPPDLTVLSKTNGGVFPTDRVYKSIDGRNGILADTKCVIAAEGKLGPFVLVVEGSIPNERNKVDGFWAAFGTDATGQPIHTTDWIDRLARDTFDVQDESGQVRQPKAAGCEKVFREKITGTTVDRPQVGKLMKRLAPSDVVITQPLTLGIPQLWLMIAVQLV